MILLPWDLDPTVCNAGVNLSQVLDRHYRWCSTPWHQEWSVHRLLCMPVQWGLYLGSHTL